MSHLSPFARRYRSVSALVAACLILLAPPGPAHAQSPVVDRNFEYALKAGFLLNFFKLIEWPPAAAPGQTPFRLTVIDDEEVRNLIASALDNKQAGGHPVEVTSATATDSLSDVHMVFVPRTSRVDPKALAARLAGKPVLIVGEDDGFVASGGQIGLVLRGSNLRIQLNLDATRAVGLRPSAKLSTVAEIVRPKKP